MLTMKVDTVLPITVLVYSAIFIGVVTACGIPAYVDIEAEQPTKILSVAKAHGICVQSGSGKFIVVSSKTRPSLYLYDNNAVLMKTVAGPVEAKGFSYCVYSSSSIFITDPIGRQIFKYDEDGENPRVLVEGKAFFGIVMGGTALFISELDSSVIYLHDNGPGKLRKMIEAGGRVCGMAFDSNGYLHCAMVNTNEVKIFDPEQGKFMKRFVHMEASSLTGLVMDGCGNTVLSDSGEPSQVLTYSPKANLIKRLAGGLYKRVVDIGISQGSLIVSDFEADKVYFYQSDHFGVWPANNS